jgi:uncharacterized protein YggT (Ycf19 family)
MRALALLIRLLTVLVVALIAAGILLWVLGANGHNTVVSDVHSAAKWVVGPFQNVFHIKGRKADLAVNWGLALVIYAIVGGFLSRLLSRPMSRRAGFRRRTPPAA